MGLKKPPTINEILKKIRFVRNQHVILDSDLSNLIGVATKKLNEKVKNNPNWLPKKPYFKMASEEVGCLMAKIGTSKNYTLRNRKDRPIAYALEGVQRVGMLFRKDNSLRLIQAVRTILTTDCSNFDYANSSYEKVLTHARIICLKSEKAQNDSDPFWGQRIMNVEVHKWIYAQEISNKKNDSLEGWEILEVVSKVLAMNLPCPKWLLEKFKEKIDVVLLGTAPHFGDPRSFYRFPGGIGRIRENIGTNQSIHVLADRLLSADKNRAKIAGKRLLKIEDKDTNGNTGRECVFRVMANFKKLQKVLIELEVMTKEEISKNRAMLEEISKLPYPTIHKIYKEKIRELKNLGQNSFF